MAANAAKMMQIQRQVMFEDLLRKEIDRQPQEDVTPGGEDEEEKFEVDSEGAPAMDSEEAEVQLGMMGTYQRVFL